MPVQLVYIAGNAFVARVWRSAGWGNRLTPTRPRDLASSIAVFQ